VDEARRYEAESLDLGDPGAGRVGAWIAAEQVDLAEITRAAMDTTVPPDFRVMILSSTGDTLGLKVTAVQPTLKADQLAYVERRGSFEVLRVETWPPN